MKSIPALGDLTPIELAVWAAEYVRARTAGMYAAAPPAPAPLPAYTIERAIDSADYAVSDLRDAMDRR